MRRTFAHSRPQLGCSRQRLAVIAVALGVILSGVLSPTLAQPSGCEHPLLMEGKRNLYQRVLTNPGAGAYDRPGGRRQQSLVAMSRLYVYERRTEGGAEWLRLGTDDRCEALVGWVPAAGTLPWRQQLTLAFTAPAGRDRALLFRGLEDLLAVADSPDPPATAAQINATLDNGGRDERVVAQEPKLFVDLSKRFYLLPILDFKDFTTRDGQALRALKVASVTLPPPPGSAPATDPVADPKAFEDFRAAIVFVIDSTASMQPYINETRAAIEHFYRRIEAAGLLDHVSFGLVAFRAPVRDQEKGRRLGYVSQVFVSPSDATNAESFLRRVASLHEASDSTDYFDEDPYAGIDAALKLPGLTEHFPARFVVLITDAGALDGSPLSGQPDRPGPQSQARKDADTLRAEAARRGVALAVMHLQTEEAQARGNVERAKAQYQVLADNGGQFNQEAYFPIANGDPQRFRQAIDKFANAIIELMARTRQGDLSSPAPAPKHQLNAEGKYVAPNADPGDTAALLGHAMRLAYLGARQGARVPETFEAWMTDADLRDPGLRSAEVRVLMSRDQLSNMREIVLNVIAAAEGSLQEESTTRQFYDRLASVAAWFERREDGGGSSAAALAENDLLLEYLDGLPYKSDVLELKRDDWTRWGIERQTQFLDRLRKKAGLYRQYYGSLDGWIDIAQSQDEYGRQPVYPVPLRDLP